MRVLAGAMFSLSSAAPPPPRETLNRRTRASGYTRSGSKTTNPAGTRGNTSTTGVPTWIGSRRTPSALSRFVKVRPEERQGLRPCVAILRTLHFPLAEQQRLAEQGHNLGRLPPRASADELN